jgi:ABC-type branched-subunit amino acid transport system substrate-binding protein
VRAVLAVFLAWLSACTPSAPPEEGLPVPRGDIPRPPLTLAVVASLTGPTAASDGTYLDGMRLAEAQAAAGGRVGRRGLRVDVADDRGDPDRARSLLAALLRSDVPAAVFVVGPGDPLADLRRDVEAFAGPAVLLGGDLYSSRSLYRQVFQTSVPVLWQARAIARYLARDRRHDRVVMVTEAGPGAAAVREAFDAAMAEEGSGLEQHVAFESRGPRAPVLEAASGADALVFAGSAGTAARIARGLARRRQAPQLLAASDALSPEFAAAGPAPGTVAPYPYTWAGWAQPIPRVRAFRLRFREEYGRTPVGHEQEGYDAVRALIDALAETRGRTGPRLVRALESLPWRPYSSLPVELGPDDHVFLGEHELGLFAVPGPEEEAERWVGPRTPWRPIMRTFTPDLERTGVLDRDKRVFFPWWRKNRPAPKYWTSRFGIVTRPGDPLH